MTHRIVLVEPTLLQQNKGWAEIDKQGFATDDTEVAPIYRAMLSAAEPFEWPEEAVEAADHAHYLASDATALYADYFKGLCPEARKKRQNEMRDALNAALKVVEGRE